MLKDLESTQAKAVTGMFDELGPLVVDLAKQNLAAQGFITRYPSELEASIQYERVSDDELIVSADAGFAAYVEFGTGIVGAGSPHPEASEKGVKYDRNKHGEKGWVYFKNDKFRRTRGQTSKPFMYETAQQIPDVAMEALGRQLTNARKGKKGKK
jgi:hypothetical protein